MKPFILLIFYFIFSAFHVREVDKTEFYKAFSSATEDGIDDMINRLDQEKSSSLVAAYQGALYMKKAGFVKGVNGKVKTFKKGAHLLEDVIQKDPSNTEYRFLRLAIQEHAPGILGYNKNKYEDKSVVVNGFSKLNSNLKSVISNYAKDSKVLKASDLGN
ncbi:hypothetical protein [Dyadobacter frigoris]|uniref:Uncharacterized protein n=1 Tax=Dyadobacter frigoris TaxID=2576211 RepID=A0A4U6D4H1_9BACT|nr:hypothetical protein [Dyadobacter frigoris]TKT90878.1 hypothetical protein FDK13_18095 [Dyadobacter frigoris]